MLHFRFKLLLVVIILTAFIFSTPVEAATGINRKINFQGKVVNKGVGSTDGTNVVDGNHNFVFSLWTTLSAGTSIWSEVWNAGTTQVTVTSGIFQVALGSQSTFPPSIDFNSDGLYLSVNYEVDGEMSPRIQMTAVPYAFNAEKVGGLTVTSTNGTLTIPNGATIAFGDNFTTMGVGISLNQNLTTANEVTFAGLSVGGTVSFTNIPIGTGTTILYIGAGGVLVQGTLPAGGTYTATNGLNLNGTVIGLGGTLVNMTKIDLNSNNLNFFGVGKVGIGTTDPEYKLHVVGEAVVSTKLGVGATSTKAFTVTTDASIGTNLSVGGSLTFTGLPVGIGTSVLYIDGSGNIVSGTLPVATVANSKTIVLSPEYPGASLSADGSATTSVSMTSDNTLNAGGIGWKNFYELVSADASLQDYSVIVRITLPSDFGSWQTGSCPGATCALEMAFQTGLSTVADNAISYIVSNDTDTPGTAVCSVGATAATSWTSTGCTSATLVDGAAPQWGTATNTTAVIRIKMAAKNTSNALTRAGDITLRYLSKF